MSPVRIISRLDVKGPNLIKGVHLEGLRVLGEPAQFSTKYYEQGADEIIYLDLVASLYGRSHLAEIISRAAQGIFIPMTVGGGIRSLEDATALLRAGADKVAINTAAVKRPSLLGEIADRYGKQCVVLSIEAKKLSAERWEPLTDCGREHSGLDVVDWAKKASHLGAGEILLTSIDQEGTRQGFDLALIKAVCQAVDIPVIASGGFGKLEDLKLAIQAGASAIAVADMLHYNRLTLKEIREFGLKNQISLRSLP